MTENVDWFCDPCPQQARPVLCVSVTDVPVTVARFTSPPGEQMLSSAVECSTTV
ncbi:hypothetical protein [Kineococcus indalonis]|uniref:hypothetical protein n=1 Tax=Kineococcus indalonis TaxID=2696566 RepID=UPI001411E193|nr:hypothetical protein [Kineococcus indalonis]NAZ86925.1 hypothetical protein [Kineococcus indalonis]